DCRPVVPAGWKTYQLALRRPGTSPFMVALRSMLRPRLNFWYTPRGRPVRAPRVVLRAGEESRGNFCSLITAASRSSYEALGLEMIFFSSARRSAYLAASIARFRSRLTMEVLAIV